MTKKAQNSLSLYSESSFTVTPIGLVIKGEVTFDDWANLGLALGKYHRGIAWAVGDWISQGEYRFGEMYAQSMDATGLSLGRLRNLKSLADRVPYENRVDGLSLSHHEAVAPFSHEMQRKLLAMAVEQDLGRDELRKIVAELHALTDGEQEETVDDMAKEEDLVLPPLLTDRRLVEKGWNVVNAWHEAEKKFLNMPWTTEFLGALVELENLLREMERAYDSNANEL